MSKPNEKYLAAIPDVEAVIEKHGYDAVRWVVNKLREKNQLRRQLTETKKEYEKKIRDIENKLNSKPA
jgi:uncharacterized protein YeeX (DUF496 family)